MSRHYQAARRERSGERIGSDMGVAQLQWFPLLLYGLLSLMTGVSVYLFGVMLAIPRYLLGLDALLLTFNEKLVWYSGVPAFFGILLIGLDLWLLLPARRSDRVVTFEPP